MVIVVVHSHLLLFKQIQGGEVLGNKEAHLPTSLMRYACTLHTNKITKVKQKSSIVQSGSEERRPLKQVPYTAYSVRLQ